MASAGKCSTKSPGAREEGAAICNACSGDTEALTGSQLHHGASLLDKWEIPFPPCVHLGLAAKKGPSIPQTMKTSGGTFLVFYSRITTPSCPDHQAVESAGNIW